MLALDGHESRDGAQTFKEFHRLKRIKLISAVRQRRSTSTHRFVAHKNNVALARKEETDIEERREKVIDKSIQDGK